MKQYDHERPYDHKEWTRQFIAALPANNQDDQDQEKRAGFAVYQHNHLHGLSTALSERFPLCVKLVGQDCFFGLCAAYITAGNLPGEPFLASYGKNFPDFLDQSPLLSDYPWLGDVARLEYVQGEAYHAKDAPFWHDLQALALLSEEELTRLYFTPHPSLRLLKSPWPVFQIYRSQVNDTPLPPRANWNAEYVILSRPEKRVEIIPVSAQVFSFIDHLYNGASLSEALIDSLDDQSDDNQMDAAGLLHFLHENPIMTSIYFEEGTENE